MAYESLKAMIRQYIKPNDNEEITGAILQGVLLEMVQELGVAGSYLPLTGGTLTGNVMVSSNAQGDTHDAVLLSENAVTVEDVNAVGLNQSLQMTASGLIYTAGYPSQQSQQMSVAFGFTGITVSGGITATSFINSSVAEAVRGQYLLKADGSVVSMDSFASSERVATLEGYFTDGSANSALKLTTARTLWGQPFDGTANVSGSISDATTITASGIINANGGIQIPSGRTLQIGNAILSWDSENNAIRITTGFYSDTFISALGVGSSGGGGSIDMEQVWEALAASTNEQINATHLTTALTGYATQSWVISQGFTGSVTSITAGTGLSGGTITTSGTIAISTEYQGYISHGETAYNQLSELECVSQMTGGNGILTMTTNKGNSFDVDLTHQHSWFEVQDRPTTLKGYGISADDELLMENFLTIAFFNRLFKAHNGNVDVDANDISSTIDSIEAMFGFWTEQYISALGQSSGGGSGIGDVTWETLADNTDTRQIALSHLTTALAAYATQSWVTALLSSYATQSWVTTQLASYATQQWVISQGYTTNVGTVTSLTAGTGLSGGTITSSGTIAISSEYQEYINNGNTAYGWGNHALAGYATQEQLNALEYLNQATGGDGVITLTTNKGNATIVDLTHEHSWFEIQDRPTTLLGLGISADDELLTSNFLTIAFFNRLFRAYNGNTEVNANDTSSTIDNIKAMFGFWTEQYVSALGQSSGGGGGVGDVTWELLADNTDTRQIALSHLTTALTYYATQSWVTTQIGKLEYLNQASGEDGVLSLITNKGNATLIDLTHQHSWFEIQDRPTTLVAYGITSNDELLNTVLNTALSGYLPLTGGTIIGGLTVNGGITTSGITASGNVTAAKFVRSGGTASQFLKADGSVDSTAYTTNVGTVTSIGTGTGLTGGTITVSGTISISSEYQGYISNGNTAYGWGNHATFGYATVAQLNALEFLNQVSGGDGLITLTTNKSNSTVLDLTHQHSWFEVQDRPTTILGYGITDGVFTGSVTIGSNELNTNYRLTVNGNTRTNRLYLTDSVYLEYNSTTGGIHVVGAGLYSDTFISALGASTGTAGGVGDVTWEALASNSDSRQIAASHLTNVLSNYLSTNGGTLHGGLTLDNTSGLFVYNDNGVNADISIQTDLLGISMGVNAHDDYIYIEATDTIYINNTIRTSGFVKSGGTSTQFLKADGSVDEFTGGNGVLTLSGSGTQIDLTHQHSWFEIQDKPDTFQGFGIKGGTLSSTLSLNRNVLDFADDIVYANAWKVVGTSIYRLDFWGADMYRFDSRMSVAGSVTATEYITSSDLQKKDIVEYVQNLTVYNVADAPLFRYTWKNSKDKTTHIGTAAQYWQTVTPELVHVGMDTFLTMQYDVIALASAITVARTVVSHEERITILEKENEALRKEIEKLKAA